MALKVAALFLVLAIPAVYGAISHVVGGSNGWDTGVDYNSWAKGETFNVGDTLVFNYGSLHGVDVVSKNDYDNCNPGNALETYSGGSTTYNLTKAGQTYFMCPTTSHCGQGMKLAVSVKDSGGSGSTPAPPTSPSTPSGSGSTTPSTTPSGSGSPSSNSSPTSPSGTNAATGSFGSISYLVLSFSLVLAALIVRA
ncbi:OLC1v1038506C1 [Oldenlandia corymbosa var. corymbosa]|uniref:OLC1v1038506C1 n=1 Tax=Oldenlandia corymbosa var. corymbosa TaxID=529605 RepID=A0AAV1D3R0_OLDCO|nr:OLC1v1038506C1 [Oldenlandia corymbosa var. corymbosa]